jgi:hypothetical protein
MGAWGFRPFDNDDACDWLDDFEDQGFDAAQAAFEATEEQDYLGAPEGSAAVAAAAVIASLLDGRVEMIPEETLPSVERLGSERATAEKFREPALNALKRVAAADSELKELWADTDELSDWQKSLIEIRDRIDKK